MTDKHITRIDSTLGKRDTAKAEGERGIDVMKGLSSSTQHPVAECCSHIPPFV